MSLYLVPFAIERRTDARPVVTIALLATTLALQVATAASLVDPAALAFEWQAPTILDALASQVVHADFLHWLFNAIGLALFATTVEDAIGGRRFLSWLGVTVAAAVLVEWVAFHRYEGSSYGSSGIVFACIGGALVLAPGTRLRMTFASLQHRRAWSLPMWAVAILYAGYELWRWLKSSMAGDALRAGGEQVSELVAATPMMHLAGFAVGAGAAYAGLKLGLLDVHGADLLQRRDLEREAHRLGGFVAPSDGEPRGAVYPEQPKCEHCGRNRPARLQRCMYCGEA